MINAEEGVAIKKFLDWFLLIFFSNDEIAKRMLM